MAKRNVIRTFFIIAFFNLASAGLLNSFGNSADTLNIVNKAKLLTLSPIGLNQKDSLVNEVINQNHHIFFHDSVYIIIVIEKKQSSKTIFNGGVIVRYCENVPCSFVVVYSKMSGLFYRIDGFGYTDFPLLYSECRHIGYPISRLFTDDYTKKSIVNLNCLMLSVRPARKGTRRLECGCNCQVCIETIIK